MLILYQVIETLGDLDRKIGLFLGLSARAAMTIGGYLSMQEEVGATRRERYRVELAPEIAHASASPGITPLMRSGPARARELLSLVPRGPQTRQPGRRSA